MCNGFIFYICYELNKALKNVKINVRNYLKY
jgi:hypothetical protein